MRKGYTLVELIVVLVILGIFVSAGFPLLVHYKKLSSESILTVNFHVAEKIVEDFLRNSPSAGAESKSLLNQIFEDSGLNNILVRDLTVRNIEGLEENIVDFTVTLEDISTGREESFHVVRYSLSK
ncbi:type II secretion system protein [Kosmotoga olearia]|uniref:Prepilin-type N-terminal cleavage/methylation domain-containing protein n=1 Tax=Kosmotoga olearia (strain ATCC BAA-1733 / DSM 21960 / TBF 19.5.1) TaxID=521045 RepID=C5CFM4_KOSOT|nr:type II secretion system protein [Kosmotoga olearia]ACR79442.1 hypothetical protein Kole_0727 [Kosmotoga olearia TBF 19.5.1]